MTDNTDGPHRDSSFDDLGNRLRLLRLARGLSQRELAARAGVSNAVISLIEQNKTNPSVGLLKKILDGLPLSIRHFDFYRFDDPHEWEDAGFRELFASPGLKLVEWPEKAAGLLPPADLRLYIEPGEGDRREARFEAHTARGRELLR